MQSAKLCCQVAHITYSQLDDKIKKYTMYACWHCTLVRDLLVEQGVQSLKVPKTPHMGLLLFSEKRSLCNNIRSGKHNYWLQLPEVTV